jgi:hypothetical protein
VAAISSTDAVAAVVAILIAGAVMLGSMYGFRYAFTYALENSRIDIRILGGTVRRGPFSDIDHVEVIPFAALVPFRRPSVGMPSSLGNGAATTRGLSPSKGALDW